MSLQKDLREFIELLNALNVRFVIVGAFAVAYHGYFRYTADIDLFIDALGGAVTFRLLQGHAPLTTKFTNALVTLLLSGCRTKESR